MSKLRALLSHFSSPFKEKEEPFEPGLEVVFDGMSIDYPHEDGNAPLIMINPNTQEVFYLIDNDWIHQPEIEAVYYET